MTAAALATIAHDLRLGDGGACCRGSHRHHKVRSRFCRSLVGLLVAPICQIFKATLVATWPSGVASRHQSSVS